jgi:ferredoxin
MTREQKLTVDPVACTGHGVCAELLPELIDHDDWGYPRLPDRPLPARLHGAARRALTACPALALDLRDARPSTGRA